MGGTAGTGGEAADRRLGEIAVLNGSIDSAQLEECISIQSQMAERGFRMRLGKILIEKYYIDRITLAALLRAQAQQRGLRLDDVDTSVDQIKFTPREHDLVVERVRESKVLSPERADECFDIQFALEQLGIDKQLAEVGIEQGYITRDLVSDILDRRGSAPPPLVQEEPEEEEVVPEGGDSGILEAVQARIDSESLQMSRQFRFGKIAEEKELATEDQIKDGLYVQFRLKEMGVIKRIGDVLVEKSVLRPPDVRRILQLQKQRIGRVRWSDLAQLGETDPADADLARALLESGLLGQEEIEECRYVQKALGDLGAPRRLGQVVWEKELVERKFIQELEGDLAAAAETSLEGRQGRALDTACYELLPSMGSQDGQPEESAVSEVSRPTRVSQRVVYSRSRRRGVGRWIAFIFVLLLGLAAGAGWFFRLGPWTGAR